MQLVEPDTYAHDPSSEFWSALSMVILSTSIGTILMSEIYQFQAYRTDYLMDVWNCVDIVTLFIVVVRTPCWIPRPPTCTHATRMRQASLGQTAHPSSGSSLCA